MRARCVFCVCRRPADTPRARRTARPLLRSRPEDSTNITPNSASSLPAVRDLATPPRKLLALVPRRTAVQEVTILRIQQPRLAACQAVRRLSVITRTASNQLTGRS